jgi:hypothetical protein
MCGAEGVCHSDSERRLVVFIGDSGGMDQLELVSKQRKNSSGKAGARPRRKSWAAIFAGLLVAGLATTGCSESFSSSKTVDITSPAPLTTVQVPFTAQWKSTAPPGTRYALFLDQQPIPPDHTMRDLADTGCKRVAACYPDPSLLAGDGVYLTTQDHFQVQTIPTAIGMTAHENPPMHTLDIVLFTGTGASTKGHRIGEGVWQVEFRGANSLAAFGGA